MLCIAFQILFSLLLPPPPTPRPPSPPAMLLWPLIHVDQHFHDQRNTFMGPEECHKRDPTGRPGQQLSVTVSLSSGPSSHSQSASGWGSGTSPPGSWEMPAQLLGTSDHTTGSPQSAGSESSCLGHGKQGHLRPTQLHPFLLQATCWSGTSHSEFGSVGQGVDAAGLSKTISIRTFVSVP